MEKFCISEDYTIKETIERIDQNKNRVVFVVNKENKLVGVVSQGDIIRALCAGKSIYHRVDSLIRADFIYLNSRDMEKAYRLFKQMKITLLPVVDDDFRILSVISLDDIFSYMEQR